MHTLKDVKIASLEIDERFLEEFTAMTYGWNYEHGKASEAGRLLLHLFGRIAIVKYEKGDGQTGWVLTVFGEESPEDYDNAKECTEARLARRMSTNGDPG